jgi:hypothetical protein
MIDRLAEILEDDYYYEIVVFNPTSLVVDDDRPNDFEEVIEEIVRKYSEMRNLDYEVFGSNKGAGVEVYN